MATDTSVQAQQENPWEGNRLPFGASYGKLMMWFFLLSDAFTFSALLLIYGFLRMGSTNWPNPEKVFESIPFIVSSGAPLVFVGVMTFILILSSLTMVLAVEAGQNHDERGVINYSISTIALGALFLSCQAMEWTHMIQHGTTLSGNHYGDAMFGQLFYVITGFHGFHVFSGIMLIVIALIMTLKGVFRRRGHYEMIEKIGLYWHFVDLVWVFVFTLFYLI
jgi:cytochrome c oxidase subunit 3